MPKRSGCANDLRSHEGDRRHSNLFGLSGLDVEAVKT
jgi:hypothetical protein